MNTQQIRDEIRDALWEWAEVDTDDRDYGWRHRTTGEISFAINPIPDTLDAAVGVIEGAGYIVQETYYNCENDAYTAIAWKPHTDIKVRVVANGDSTAATYNLAHWQLALACVKATVTNDNNPPAISQNGG